MWRSPWALVGLVVLLVLLGRKTVFAVKAGAILSNDVAVEHARRVIAGVWAQYGYTLTVTSGYDGTHRAQSKHYDGLAEDYRTRDVTPTDLEIMVGDVRAALGRDYDVVLEPDHLHVEYDPKP